MTIPFKSAKQKALEVEVQNTAKLIMTWLKQSLPTPRDAAMALALANTALIWTQEQEDEAKVRELMAQTTEVVVAMWRAQKAAAEEVKGGEGGKGQPTGVGAAPGNGVQGS